MNHLYVDVDTTIPKWGAEETVKLAEMRSILGPELYNCPQYSELVGDRRLLRFLQGREMDVKKACTMFQKFLKFREEYNVNEIRDNIVKHGMNCALKFPNGAKLLAIQPQVICSPTATDKLGNPISVESYGFSPRVAMESTTVSEYVTYLIYCMEYKACIMEEMCIDAEKKIIEKYHGKPPPGYGVLFKSCIIVDFKGLGLGHIGGDGQKMASAALKIATSYYPEMLFKSNMINVTWIFNSIFPIIKLLLDAKTMSKISLYGEDYLDLLQTDIDLNKIPSLVGGEYPNADNEVYIFKYLGSENGERLRVLEIETGREELARSNEKTLNNTTNTSSTKYTDQKKVYKNSELTSSQLSAITKRPNFSVNTVKKTSMVMEAVWTWLVCFVYIALICLIYCVCGDEETHCLSPTAVVCVSCIVYILIDKIM